MSTNRGTTTGIAGLVLGLALLGSGAAYGTVQVDLRFDDGSKTKVAMPGDFAIDVWVSVVGTDPAKRDGLIWAMGYVQSTQIGNGAVVGASDAGITGNVAAPGGAFTVSGLAGQAGVAQDLTHDGIQDWGATSTTNLNHIKYSSTRDDLGAGPGTTPVYGDTPGVIAQAIPNGTEYKVGTLTFHVGQVNYAALANGATTQINWGDATGYLPGQISCPDEAGRPTSSADEMDAHYLPSLAGVNSVEFTAAQPAAGYSYATAAGSPKIAKVQLPAVGGGTFDLYAPADEAITLPAAPGLATPGLVSAPGGGDDWVLIASGVTAGSLFALPYPVSDLQIRGISAAAAIDPNDTSAFPVDFVFEGDAAGSVTRVALVPEPGSLALLGLTGLVLLRRGRR